MPNSNVSNTYNSVSILNADAPVLIDSIKTALLGHADGGYWLSETGGNSVLISDAEIGTNFIKFNDFIQNHKASGAKDFVYVIKTKDNVKLLSFGVDDALGINNQESFDTVSIKSDMDDISINSILSNAIAGLDSDDDISLYSGSSERTSKSLSSFLDGDDGYIFHLQSDESGINIRSVLAKYKIAELGSSVIGIARHLAAAATADTSSDEGKAIAASAALATVGSASDTATAVLNVSGITGNGVIALGASSGVLNALSNFIHIGIMTSNFKNLSYKEQIVTGVEIGMKVAGSFGLAISSASNAILTANHVASSIPGLGAAAASLSLAISPVTILSILNQSDRVKAIAELGDTMKRAGYEGDSILAELLKDKLTFDASTASISMGISVATAVTSAAASASVVGAPVAAVAGAASGVILGILEATKQPILESIAAKYRAKLEDLGGAQKIFDKGLDTNFKLDIASKTELLKELQSAFGADYVVAAGGVKASETAIELAAITYNTDKLQTAANLAAMVKKGNEVTNSENEKKLVIDGEKGTLQISSSSGEKALITFSTPIFAPGVEQNQRSQTGKHDYYTKLLLKAPKDGYTIKAGDADEVFRLDDKYASVIIDQESGNLKNLRLNIDAGKGDDKLIANSGFNNFNGAQGNDVAIYSGENISKIWLYTDDNGSYIVSKAIKDADVAHEDIKTKHINYGKRSEKVEYRDFTIKQASYIATDELKNVEAILGSNGDDEMKGGSGNDVFAGGEGNDKLYGGSGNDVLIGGNGDDRLYGNDGNDVLIGGSGKNYLNGGDGNDVYIISADGVNLIKDSSGDDTMIINGITGNFLVRAQGEKTMIVFEDGSFAIANKNTKVLASLSSDFSDKNALDVTSYGMYLKTENGISLSSNDTHSIDFSGISLSSSDSEWLA